MDRIPERTGDSLRDQVVTVFWVPLPGALGGAEQRPPRGGRGRVRGSGHGTDFPRGKVGD